MVVVLLLIGFALMLAAPALMRPLAASQLSEREVIGSARRLAVDRAQTVRLVVGPDGAWTLTEPEAPDHPLGKGVLSAPAVPLYLTISPLGVCMMDEAGGPQAATIDPVSCTVSARDRATR